MNSVRSQAGPGEAARGPMQVLLIRHARTASNTRRLLDTAHPGPEIDEHGHGQAAALADRLRGRPIDALVSSDLRRTQMTVAPLAADRGVTVPVDPRLREIPAGVLEMRGDEEAVAQYTGLVEAWLTGRRDRSIPGGEDGAQFFARFDGAINDLYRAGHRTVAVVTHSLAIMTWAGAQLELGPDWVLRHVIPNTGFVELVGHPGAWTLVDWPTPEPQPVLGSVSRAH